MKEQNKWKEDTVKFVLPLHGYQSKTYPMVNADNTSQRCHKSSFLEKDFSLVLFEKFLGNCGAVKSQNLTKVTYFTGLLMLPIQTLLSKAYSQVTLLKPKMNKI